jgi:hypothetical protein
MPVAGDLLSRNVLGRRRVRRYQRGCGNGSRRGHGTCPHRQTDLRRIPWTPRWQSRRSRRTAPGQQRTLSGEFTLEATRPGKGSRSFDRAGSAPPGYPRETAESLNRGIRQGSETFLRLLANLRVARVMSTLAACGTMRPANVSPRGSKPSASAGRPVGHLARRGSTCSIASSMSIVHVADTRRSAAKAQ